jgi:hypothetical protein
LDGKRFSSFSVPVLDSSFRRLLLVFVGSEQQYPGGSFLFGVEEDDAMVVDC